MIIERNLQRDEIGQIWTIDRSEQIEHIYYFKGGALVLRPERHDMRGWPPGEADLYEPILIDCYDRGGWFCGVFEDTRLVGVAILESRFIGAIHDQLQLKFLHVSNGYRGRGLGRRLFELAQDEARARGARRLYISATPSENTIDFYLRRGCVLTPEPEPELLALEPEDIHLECDLAQ
jgi:predicted N-acetyltransferase YhbS